MGKHLIGSVIVLCVLSFFHNDLFAIRRDSVIYKITEQAELKLFIYTPDQSFEAPYPAVVFFFGGGWETGDVGQFSAHSRHLASRGVVGITAQYRIKTKHNTSPQDAMEDAKSAIRWIRKHAGDFEIDALRIAAGGGSAGGHLALCTGLVPGFENENEDLQVSSVPNAMILFNPAVDVEPFHDRFGGIENAKAASPINFIGNDNPPCIIFHGAHDTLIDKEVILGFQEKMIENGNYCEVELFGGQDHGFFNTNRSDGQFYRRTVALMEIFLVEQGYIQ